jgi:predicted Zn-ribbon and HTH transcriptional regulator
MGQEPAEPVLKTRRQRLRALLAQGEWGFDELRRELDVPVRLLADDLAHVARGLRRGPGRFVVEPARCRACGFAFHEREQRHLHPPSRCPRCRERRIAPPRFRIELPAQER